MLSLVQIAAVVLVLTGLGLLLVVRINRRRDGGRRFVCAHCSTLTLHNERTRQAWQSGRAKFFCDRCHGEWSQNHSAPPMAYQADAPRRGCFGAVAGLLLLPALLIGALTVGWNAFG